MNHTKKLTVADVLRLPQFKHSALLAGKEGLNKPVSWVHVLEHVYTKDFVNGNELVLTTGARWKNDHDPTLFLDQLIEKKVSALCIQLGSKYNSYRSTGDLPQSLIAKAETNGFPLIVFPEDYDCRFIDLIHDIHSMIVRQNHEHFLNHDRWVKKWIAGELSNQEITKQLQGDDPYYAPKGCVACLISFNQPIANNEESIESLQNINSLAQSHLEMSGFKFIAVTEKAFAVYILTSAQKTTLWKKSLHATMQKFYETATKKIMKENHEIRFISIGEIRAELDHLRYSYENAQDVLHIQKILGEPTISFFEDLGVYTIIHGLDKNGDLDNFIRKHLHPVLDMIPEKSKLLLNTITVLRDCHYNKIEAAKLLYISRQSIYQRIKMLESLLGDGFINNPQTRLCTELALYGLDYKKRMELMG
jgi:sugar diacid utilization regulator